MWCGNYGNSISHNLGKNFVKATYLLNKELISRKVFFSEIEFIGFPHYFCGSNTAGANQIWELLEVLVKISTFLTARCFSHILEVTFRFVRFLTIVGFLYFSWQLLSIWSKLTIIEHKSWCTATFMLINQDWVISYT